MSYHTVYIIHISHIYNTYKYIHCIKKQCVKTVYNLHVWRQDSLASTVHLLARTAHVCVPVRLQPADLSCRSLQLGSAAVSSAIAPALHR